MNSLSQAYRLPRFVRYTGFVLLSIVLVLVIYHQLPQAKSIPFQVIDNCCRSRSYSHSSQRPEMYVITREEDVVDTLSGIGIATLQDDGSETSLVTELRQLSYHPDASFVVIITAGVGQQGIMTQRVLFDGARMQIQAAIDTVLPGELQTGDFREPIQVIYVPGPVFSSHGWYDFELQVQGRFGYTTQAVINRPISFN
jgi:hypothetical protein